MKNFSVIYATRYRASKAASVSGGKVVKITDGDNVGWFEVVMVA